MPGTSPTKDSKKVAIVHDWLVGGGAERVVYELHKLFPDAPIYTSYCTNEWRQKLDGKVVTGYLQNWPFSKLRKVLAVPRGRWFESLDLSQFDLIISSSGNGEAKAVRVREGATHICYCHTPTHYYWRHYDQYLAHPGFGPLNPLIRLALRLLVGPLRRRDLRYAQRPDYYIANSTHIQADIKRYYNRDAIVIHPPVDVERFTNIGNNQPRHGFVTVGRQVPQKYTAIIVQACTKLKQPLTVIGSGPEHDSLMRMAGPTITFITGQDASDDRVSQALVNAEAFIFAALDDFGLTPVEAMAAGTPVIAYRAGGALDYVKPGVTGAFFEQQTTEALATALQAFDSRKYDHATIRQEALTFSSQAFSESFTQYVTSLALTRKD